MAKVGMKENGMVYKCRGLKWEDKESEGDLFFSFTIK
jgi:hypothetical protein